MGALKRMLTYLVDPRKGVALAFQDTYAAAKIRYPDAPHIHLLQASISARLLNKAPSGVPCMMALYLLTLEQASDWFFLVESQTQDTDRIISMFYSDFPSAKKFLEQPTSYLSSPEFQRLRSMNPQSALIIEKELKEQES